MSALRALGLLPLLCMLAACWQSDRTLIDAAHAVTPPIAGTYRPADPEEQGKESMQISAGGDGAFVFDQGKDRQRVSLAQLRGDWFIMQWQPIKDGAPFEGGLYMLLRLGKGRLEVHDAPCDAGFDDIAGMKRENTTCTFTTFRALRQAAERTLGRIEAGRSEGEPAVLIRQ